MPVDELPVTALAPVHACHAEAHGRQLGGVADSGTEALDLYDARQVGGLVGRNAVKANCDDLDAATRDPELWARPRGPYESDLGSRWFVPIENVNGENRAWCCAR